MQPWWVAYKRLSKTLTHFIIINVVWQSTYISPEYNIIWQIFDSPKQMKSNPNVLFINQIAGSESIML